MKVRQIVDEATRLSRTGFERGVRQILRETRAIVEGARLEMRQGDRLSRTGFGAESAEIAE